MIIKFSLDITNRLQRKPHGKPHAKGYGIGWHDGMIGLDGRMGGREYTMIPPIT